jgi:hypothetical protein
MAGCSLAEYVANKMQRSAVERQLEILGEASTRLAKLEPSLLLSVDGLKLAIDLRNRNVELPVAMTPWGAHANVRHFLHVVFVDLLQHTTVLPIGGEGFG